MSSETNFTPGPWDWRTEVCERGPIGKGKEIRVSLSAPRNGDSITRTPVLTPNWNTDQGDVWQAWISCNGADASLIAAAPKLYWALKDMVDRYAPSYHDCTDDGLPECEICEARAALAEARGET